ncbi:hypothetical protein GCM10009808_11540 [Microbacterium sediminicola]|uniref:Uncharacterized protein n=1 Tax=Microbacterium sediminicola TaxID=415210 RepID=A0ABN2HZ58_9MICO
MGANPARAGAGYPEREGTIQVVDHDDVAWLGIRAQVCGFVEDQSICRVDGDKPRTLDVGPTPQTVEDLTHRITSLSPETMRGGRPVTERA